MDPLLDVASSLHLLAGGERSYLAVPKTICRFPIGLSPYCSDAREYMFNQERASTLDFCPPLSLQPDLWPVMPLERALEA